MRINKAFAPITIVLDTEDELQLLLNILRNAEQHERNKMFKGPSVYAFQINELYNKLKTK